MKTMICDREHEIISDYTVGIPGYKPLVERIIHTVDDHYEKWSIMKRFDGVWMMVREGSGTNHQRMYLNRLPNIWQSTL